jgi:hypothetical protein
MQAAECIPASQGVLFTENFDLFSLPAARWTMALCLTLPLNPLKEFHAEE